MATLIYYDSFSFSLFLFGSLLSLPLSLVLSLSLSVPLSLSCSLSSSASLSLSRIRSWACAVSDRRPLLRSGLYTHGHLTTQTVLHQIERHLCSPLQFQRQALFITWLYCAVLGRTEYVFRESFDRYFRSERIIPAGSPEVDHLQQAVIYPF